MPAARIHLFAGTHSAPADMAVLPPQCDCFSTTSTSRPRSCARRAAVWPAPPEPITSTSTDRSQLIARSPDRARQAVTIVVGRLVRARTLDRVDAALEQRPELFDLLVGQVRGQLGFDQLDTFGRLVEDATAARRHRRLDHPR